MVYRKKRYTKKRTYKKRTYKRKRTYKKKPRLGPLDRQNSYRKRLTKGRDIAKMMALRASDLLNMK